MKLCKLILALMLVSLLLTLPACGKGNGSSASSLPSSSPEPAPEPTPTPTPTPLTEQQSSGSLSVSEDPMADKPAGLPVYEFDTLSNERLSWGQGVQYNEKNQPLGSVSYQEKYGDLGAYFIAPEKAEQKTVYLTFDQGYENGYTTAILDTLQQKQVRAVFFVVGDYARRNEELMRRMVDEGHTLGNHSWGHKDATALSVLEAKEELTQLHEFVKDSYGVEMTLYRPAEGVFSERSLAVAGSLGYKSIFWSYAYRDWEVDNQPDPTATLEKCLARAHDGAIYLLHSVSSTNAAILADLIDGLRADGYALEALSL